MWANDPHRQTVVVIFRYLYVLPQAYSDYQL
jgi:hypothetical protein